MQIILIITYKTYLIYSGVASNKMDVNWGHTRYGFFREIRHVSFFLFQQAINYSFEN